MPQILRDRTIQKKRSKLSPLVRRALQGIPGEPAEAPQYTSHDLYRLLGTSGLGDVNHLNVLGRKSRKARSKYGTGDRTVFSWDDMPPVSPDPAIPEYHPKAHLDTDLPEAKQKRQTGIPLMGFHPNLMGSSSSASALPSPRTVEAELLKRPPIIYKSRKTIPVTRDLMSSAAEAYDKHGTIRHEGDRLPLPFGIPRRPPTPPSGPRPQTPPRQRQIYQPPAPVQQREPDLEEVGYSFFDDKKSVKAPKVKREHPQIQPAFFDVVDVAPAPRHVMQPSAPTVINVPKPVKAPKPLQQSASFDVVNVSPTPPPVRAPLQAHETLNVQISKPPKAPRQLQPSASFDIANVAPQARPQVQPSQPTIINVPKPQKAPKPLQASASFDVVNVSPQPKPSMIPSAPTTINVPQAIKPPKVKPHLQTHETSVFNAPPPVKVPKPKPALQQHETHTFTAPQVVKPPKARPVLAPTNVQTEFHQVEHAALPEEIQRSRLRISELEDQLATIQGELARQDTSKVERSELEKGEKEKKKIYKQIKKLTVEAQLQHSNIRLLDEAQKAIAPIQPATSTQLTQLTKKINSHASQIGSVQNELQSITNKVDVLAAAQVQRSTASTPVQSAFFDVADIAPAPKSKSKSKSKSKKSRALSSAPQSQHPPLQLVTSELATFTPDAMPFEGRIVDLREHMQAIERQNRDLVQGWMNQTQADIDRLAAEQERLRREEAARVIIRPPEPVLDQRQEAEIADDVNTELRRIAPRFTTNLRRVKREQHLRTPEQARKKLLKQNPFNMPADKLLTLLADLGINPNEQVGFTSLSLPKTREEAQALIEKQHRQTMEHQIQTLNYTLLAKGADWVKGHVPFLLEFKKDVPNFLDEEQFPQMADIYRRINSDREEALGDKKKREPKVDRNTLIQQIRDLQKEIRKEEKAMDKNVIAAKKVIALRDKVAQIQMSIDRLKSEVIEAEEDKSRILIANLHQKEEEIKKIKEDGQTLLNSLEEIVIKPDIKWPDLNNLEEFPKFIREYHLETIDNLQISIKQIEQQLVPENKFIRSFLKEEHENVKWLRNKLQYSRDVKRLLTRQDMLNVHELFNIALIPFKPEHSFYSYKAPVHDMLLMLFPKAEPQPNDPIAVPLEGRSVEITSPSGRKFIATYFPNALMTEEYKQFVVHLQHAVDVNKSDQLYHTAQMILSWQKFLQYLLKTPVNYDSIMDGLLGSPTSMNRRVFELFPKVTSNISPFSGGVLDDIPAILAQEFGFPNEKSLHFVGGIADHVTPSRFVYSDMAYKDLITVRAANLPPIVAIGNRPAVAFIKSVLNKLILNPLFLDYLKIAFQVDSLEEMMEMVEADLELDTENLETLSQALMADDHAQIIQLIENTEPVTVQEVAMYKRLTYLRDFYRTRNTGLQEKIAELKALQKKAADQIEASTNSVKEIIALRIKLQNAKADKKALLNDINEQGLVIEQATQKQAEIEKTLAAKESKLHQLNEDFYQNQINIGAQQAKIAKLQAAREDADIKLQKTFSNTSTQIIEQIKYKENLKEHAENQAKERERIGRESKKSEEAKQKKQFIQTPSPAAILSLTPKQPSIVPATDELLSMLDPDVQTMLIDLNLIMRPSFDFPIQATQSAETSPAPAPAPALNMDLYKNKYGYIYKNKHLVIQSIKPKDFDTAKLEHKKNYVLEHFKNIHTILVANGFDLPITPITISNYNNIYYNNDENILDYFIPPLSYYEYLEKNLNKNVMQYQQIISPRILHPKAIFYNKPLNEQKEIRAKLEALQAELLQHIFYVRGNYNFYGVQLLPTFSYHIPTELMLIFNQALETGEALEIPTFPPIQMHIILEHTAYRKSPFQRTEEQIGTKFYMTEGKPLQPLQYTIQAAKEEERESNKLMTITVPQLRLNLEQVTQNLRLAVAKIKPGVDRTQKKISRIEKLQQQQREIFQQLFDVQLQKDFLWDYKLFPNGPQIQQLSPSIARTVDIDTTANLLDLSQMTMNPAENRPLLERHTPKRISQNAQELARATRIQQLQKDAKERSKYGNSIEGIITRDELKKQIKRRIKESERLKAIAKPMVRDILEAEGIIGGIHSDLLTLQANQIEMLAKNADAMRQSFKNLVTQLNKKQKFWKKAIGVVAMGAVGAFTGGLLAPVGAATGAAAGAAIGFGQAFVNEIIRGSVMEATRQLVTGQHLNFGAIAQTGVLSGLNYIGSVMGSTLASKFVDAKVINRINKNIEEIYKSNSGIAYSTEVSAIIKALRDSGRRPTPKLLRELIYEVSAGQARREIAVGNIPIEAQNSIQRHLNTIAQGTNPHIENLLRVYNEYYEQNLKHPQFTPEAALIGIISHAANEQVKQVKNAVAAANMHIPSSYEIMDSKLEKVGFPGQAKEAKSTITFTQDDLRKIFKGAKTTTTTSQIISAPSTQPTKFYTGSTTPSPTQQKTATSQPPDKPLAPRVVGPLIHPDYLQEPPIKSNWGPDIQTLRQRQAIGALNETLEMVNRIEKGHSIEGIFYDIQAKHPTNPPIQLNRSEANKFFELKGVNPPKQPSPPALTPLDPLQRQLNKIGQLLENPHVNIPTKQMLKQISGHAARKIFTPKGAGILNAALLTPTAIAAIKAGKSGGKDAVLKVLGQATQDMLLDATLDAGGTYNDIIQTEVQLDEARALAEKKEQDRFLREVPPPSPPPEKLSQNVTIIGGLPPQTVTTKTETKFEIGQIDPINLTLQTTALDTPPYPGYKYNYLKGGWEGTPIFIKGGMESRPMERFQGEIGYDVITTQRSPRFIPAPPPHTVVEEIGLTVVPPTKLFWNNEPFGSVAPFPQFHPQHPDEQSDINIRPFIQPVIQKQIDKGIQQYMKKKKSSSSSSSSSKKGPPKKK